MEVPPSARRLPGLLVVRGARDVEVEMTNETLLDARDPAPDWIPRMTDEKPSDAMPTAGFEDWREQAEWWEHTCLYWKSCYDRLAGSEAARRA